MKFRPDTHLQTSYFSKMLSSLAGCVQKHCLCYSPIYLQCQV